MSMSTCGLDVVLQLVASGGCGCIAQWRQEVKHTPRFWLEIDGKNVAEEIDRRLAEVVSAPVTDVAVMTHPVAGVKAVKVAAVRTKVLALVAKIGSATDYIVTTSMTLAVAMVVVGSCRAASKRPESCCAIPRPLSA